MKGKDTDVAYKKVDRSESLRQQISLREIALDKLKSEYHELLKQKLAAIPYIHYRFLSKSDILTEIAGAIEEYADCKEEFNLSAVAQDIYDMVASHAREQSKKEFWRDYNGRP